MKGKIVVILRGFDYEQVKTVCESLLESKTIRNVEIAYNTNNAKEIITKICNEFKERLFVGVGTIVKKKDLLDVFETGVDFVLSPTSYTKEMIDLCHKHGVIAIPGAYSPSEIIQQFEFGADIVKVFPANEFSKSYAKKICEPLGSLPLIAVGGINSKNVKEYFDGGYSYVASAGGIFNKEDIINKNKENLIRSLLEFENHIIGK